MFSSKTRKYVRFFIICIKVIILWVVATIAKGNKCAAKVDVWIEIGKALK